MGVFRAAQALHRDNLGPVKIGNAEETGAHRLVVDDHHTGPALALAVAGLLGPGEAQILAQQIEQDRARLGNPFVPAAIDADSNVFHHIS